MFRQASIGVDKYIRLPYETDPLVMVAAVWLIKISVLQQVVHFMQLQADKKGAVTEEEVQSVDELIELTKMKWFMDHGSIKVDQALADSPKVSSTHTGRDSLGEIHRN